MIRIGKRRALWAALLAVAMGIGMVHVLDVHYLERDCLATAREKASEVASQVSAKHTPKAGVHVEAWRTIPVLGAPSAKVTVELSLRLASGSEFAQSYDYYFTRHGAEWVEMESGCEHGQSHGGIHQHH